MRVRVLTAGVYNGPEHRKPVLAEPGDVIEVAGGWYAAELMAAGLVSSERDEGGETPPLPEADENQAAAGPTQKKPAEPKGKKVSELRKLSDARE